MTEQQRWRLWVRFVVGSMAGGLAAMLLAVGIGSRTGAIVAVGFVTLAFAVMVVVSLTARRRPGLLVPPHLHGVDADRRRLVSEAVSRGARVADPRTAEVAAAHGRRQQTAMAALLASAGIGLYLRGASLASDHRGDSILDLLGIGFWLLVGAFATLGFVQARRAAAANTSDGG